MSWDDIFKGLSFVNPAASSTASAANFARERLNAINIAKDDADPKNWGAKNNQNPVNWGGGGYYSGPTGPTDEQKRQAAETTALAKAALGNAKRKAKRNISEIDESNQAINIMANQKVRDANRESNESFFENLLKTINAWNSNRNAIGNGVNGSFFRDNALTNLGTLLDINNNKIRTARRNSVNEIEGNRFNALYTNLINKQHIYDDLDSAARSLIIESLVPNLSAIHADFTEGLFKKNKDGSLTLDTSKAKDMGFYNNLLADIGKAQKNLLKEKPTYNAIGYIMPDGKNTANSNPLAKSLSDNTNAQYRSGGVSGSLRKAMEYNKNKTLGYDNRDKNLNMNRSEKGR